jgi:hypothetical protein
MKCGQIAKCPGRVADGHPGDILGLPCGYGQIPYFFTVDHQTAGALFNDIADKSVTVMDFTDNGYKQIVRVDAAGVDTNFFKSLCFVSAK